MSMTPGTRQQQAYRICNSIRKTREVLEALEKHAKDFDDSGAVIPAAWLDILSREVSLIEYWVGMANGAVILTEARQ